MQFLRKEEIDVIFEKLVDTNHKNNNSSPEYKKNKDLELNECEVVSKSKKQNILIDVNTNPFEISSKNISPIRSEEK